MRILRYYFRILLKTVCFTCLLTVLWTVFCHHGSLGAIPEDAWEFVVRTSSTTSQPSQAQLHPVTTRSSGVYSPLGNISSIQETAKNLTAKIIPDGCQSRVVRPEELVVPPPDTWQPCEPGKSFVFSAFVDNRQTAQWRLIIYSLMSDPLGAKPSSLKCRMWLAGELNPKIVDVEMLRFPEWKQYRYSCPLQQGQLPYAVTVVRKACETALNTLYVHIPPLNKTDAAYNFTVCVPTMHFHYDNVAEFMEMVEVNSMFGADKIVLYNYTTGPAIQPYMRMYRDEGKVDVIQWNLPAAVATSKKVHNHGLVSCINDCIYRYMHRTKYVIVADLDELIVPRLDDNWSQLLTRYLRGNPVIRGALNFRCSFFRKEMINKETQKNATIASLGLRTLLHTTREVKIWPPSSRSKYLTLPELVDVAGVHVVHRYLTSGVTHRNFPIPTEHALLHHYRKWKDPPSGPPPTKEDDFMLKYRETIVRRVAACRDKVLASVIPQNSGTVLR